MKVGIGGHARKTVEFLMFNHACYVAWLIKKRSLGGALLLVQRHALELSRRFDAKPYTCKCRGGCGRQATRAACYGKSADLTFWCESCSPWEIDADPSMFAIFRTHREVFAYADSCCPRSKTNYAHLMRQLAEAKGLPRRVGRRHQHELVRHYGGMHDNDEDLQPLASEYLAVVCRKYRRPTFLKGDQALG